MQLTAEELKRLPRGIFIKYKCDNPACQKPIASTLVYRGASGNDYCSNKCYEDCEGSPVKSKKKGSSAMAKEDTKKKKAREEEEEEEEAPKKKRKSSDDGDEEEAPKKKKKKSSDDDEEEAPKKKKKKSSDDGDDEKPKKKSSGNGKNPYREGSAGYDVFEMAVAGTTRKKILKYCDEKDIAPNRLLRELKLGEFRDVRWKYTEDEDGAIKVTIKKG